MAFALRPVDLRRDLDAIASIWTTVGGDPVTPEALRTWEKLAQPTDRRLRLIAEDCGMAVGMLGVVSTAGSATCGLRSFVLPGHRRRGLGSAFLERAREFAVSVGAPSLVVTTRDESSRAYAIKRDFALASETTILSRDVREDDSFDHPPPPGVTLTVVSDMGPDGDDLFYEAVQSLGAELAPQLGRNHFDARILGAEGRYRMLQAVALMDGRVIGVSCVEPFIGTRILLCTLTAVAASMRERGIGRALKTKALDAARRWGATQVVAHNRADNAPMLAINLRLGFRASGREIVLTS